MGVQLSIIIPVRAGGNPYLTLRHLGAQSFQAFEIIISQDEWSNANAARQAGFALTQDAPFLLFSDDDIQWRPDALACMIETLDGCPEAAYAYGSYEMGGRTYCNQVFDGRILEQRNYISTMTIIRRADFPGWDTALERLQDWELWLRMWRFSSKFGIHCGRMVFVTAVRDGITRNGKVTYEEAYRMIVEKHAKHQQTIVHGGAACAVSPG